MLKISFYFLILITIFSFSASAQKGNFNPKLAISFSYNTANKFPYANGLIDQQWTFGETRNKSFSCGGNIRYFLKKRRTSLVLKAGVFNFLKTNYSDNNNNTGVQYYLKREIKVNTVYISPGIQFNFPFKFLNFYGGLNLPINSYGKAVDDEKTDQYQPTISSGYSHVVFPSGYSIGLGIDTGVDVFLIKKVSIGAEISFAAMRTNISGTQVDSYGGTYAPNTTLTSLYSIREFGLATPKASLTLSYWFGSTPSIKDPVKID